ncbi:glucose 1-dehydrogenase [Pedobacter frigidisoli]|uniref:glucose 1-dehydrogenase n=1 Tax=Pedobacter frigidisoli TaxID=2530455 RepID=UPI00292F373E|nr:glucose 1-dehydrogenase [Pedobacter frigidisoli]
MQVNNLMSGKIGLITGAGAGIGRASAMAFARTGAKVLVSDINEILGMETVKLIVSEGGEASFFKCNVAAENEVVALIGHVIDLYGRIDFAHNNAGIVPERQPIGATSSENWQKVIDVNLFGAYYCIKHEVNAMVKSGGGNIVMTSSALGLEGSCNASSYVASKFAMNGLVKSVALEYGKAGIRINSICPGLTQTELSEQFMKDNPQTRVSALAAIPTGEMALPEDQARTAVWLCSDYSKQITGMNIAVDGGSSAGKL